MLLITVRIILRADCRGTLQFYHHKKKIKIKNEGVKFKEYRTRECISIMCGINIYDHEQERKLKGPYTVYCIGLICVGRDSLNVLNVGRTYM